MKFCRSLLILVFLLKAANASALDNGHYALPPSKVYISSCARDALILHPGNIEVQRLLHLDGNFQMLYQISMREGLEWIVICDLANGKIIRDEQAFSNSPLLK
ncbi:MAG: hypothetical protein ACR65R_04590 [Methylomicrobium sp.]